MKKGFCILLAIIMALLCGCNKDDPKAIETPAAYTISDEELYAQLNRAIRSPTSINIWISGAQTFTVVIISEPMVITVDGIDGTYQVAMISRNINDYFVLDLAELQEYPQAGDIVRITGFPQGSIYWTKDVVSYGASWTEDIHVLDVKVKSFELYQSDEIEIDTGPLVDANTPDASGMIEFIGAHFTEDDFGKIVIVYFNFTNTSDKDTEPIMNRLWFSMGEGSDYMTTSIHLPYEVDSKALSAYKAAGVSIGVTTVGTTDLYYGAFRVGKDNNDTVLYINRYDDNFNWTNSIVIDVAPSLGDMNPR